MCIYGYGKNWRTDAKREEIAASFTAERRKRGLAGSSGTRVEDEPRTRRYLERKHGRFLSKAS
jgi:hypothetical protein